MPASDHRLERLELTLAALRIAAAGNIVVVEGRRDVEALEALGIGGEHRMVHVGQSLQTWVDALAEEVGSRTVILLLDWDRTGTTLYNRIAAGLRGRVKVDGEHRLSLARACAAACVEHVPSELKALRSQALGTGLR